MSQPSDAEPDLGSSSSESPMSMSPQPVLHPLLIDHVAENVFSFLGWNCTNKDLLACRQVCKLWYNVVSDGVKKRDQTPLIFKHDDTDRLTNFLALICNTTNLPHDKYSFDRHFFVLKHTNLFNSFLSISSEFITSLSLTIGKHYTLTLRSLDYSGLSFHNLKNLTLRCSYLHTMPDGGTNSSCTWLPQHPQRQMEGVLSLFKAVLGTTRHLESFEFDLPITYFDGDYAKVGNEELGQVLVEHLPETVVNLKMTMKISDSHLRGLERLRLKRLQLHFYGRKLDQLSLTNFLHQQSASLLELRLVDLENVYLNMNDILPEFSSLTLFETKDSEFYKYHPATVFPRLKKFVVLTQYSDLHKQRLQVPANTCYASVNEISLQYCLRRTDTITTLLRYFPNITVCRIQARNDSDQVMDKIFENLKNLKELEIHFSNYVHKFSVDPMLTGLPIEYCRLIHMNTGLYVQGPGRRSVLEEVPRHPSLELLPQLEKLTLNVTSPDVFLTDVSVYFALMRAPSLRSVKLEGYHNISSECLDQLRMQVEVTEDLDPSHELHAQSHITLCDADLDRQKRASPKMTDYATAIKQRQLHRRPLL